MRRCDIQGLAQGGCNNIVFGAASLCSYHQKVLDGLALPPGAENDKEGLAGSAVSAAASYAGSTHPEFALFVDTGQYVLQGQEVA